MHELVINLHMHTSYSDGHGNHAEIAQAALKSGLDAVIVTDHNVWVNGLDGYYRDGKRQVLMMIGEEVHDQAREPQKNHLLIIGVGRELANLGHDTQQLLKVVRESDGLAFLAHPIDPPAPAFGEPDISWVDWDIQDFNGIELWNVMSEFKGLLKSKLHAVFYAYNPKRIARGPFKATLQKWDALLSKGRPVVAIGGSDAHEFPASLGPLHRRLFPYAFHFRCVNTHVWIEKPLSGELANDHRQIIYALRKGHAFIGYDLPAPTRGFRFTAQGKDGVAWMGDQIEVNGGVTLQIYLPRRTECHLLKDGKVIKVWRHRETCTHITSSPGVYRVEAYVDYLGTRRGWIFSNPIYVKG
ncbi:MAG: PHP domain-containing protein [Anaerolineales bacterium]|nr:PHP domain-containing protein [Anaerolineales bacterium]